jgi:hypothetical protein
MENTADNGSLVSEDKLTDASVEGESTANIVDASSERHQPSDGNSTFENPSHLLKEPPHVKNITTLDPGVTENGQILSDFEKSPPPDDGGANEHTDEHTSPQPLVSDDDRLCEEERGGIGGGEEDGVNSSEQTNKDV